MEFDAAAENARFDAFEARFDAMMRRNAVFIIISILWGQIVLGPIGVAARRKALSIDTHCPHIQGSRIGSTFSQPGPAASPGATAYPYTGTAR